MTDTVTASPSLFEVLRSYSTDTDNPDTIDLSDPDDANRCPSCRTNSCVILQRDKTVYTPSGSRITERKSEILKEGDNFIVKVTDLSRGKVIKTVRGNGVDIPHKRGRKTDTYVFRNIWIFR